MAARFGSEATRFGRWMAAGAAAGLIALTGCAGFFPPVSSTTGSGTTGSGNYVFALAPVLGTVSAYTIGTSTLTVGSGSPVTLPASLVSATAGAVTVSRNDEFLYVAGIDAIYCYSIGTSGALTLEANSSVSGITANFVSMDTSPDGNYLFALDSLSQDVFQFALNTSTGAISSLTEIPYKIASGATNVPKTIHAGASGTGLVIAALGTGGDAIFTYTSTAGLTFSETINSPATTLSDNDAAVDSTGTYLYVARSGYTGSTATNEVVTYKLSTAVVASTAVTGSTPYSILMDSTGDYIYTANRGSSTVSEFSVASGVLTALPTSSLSPGMVVTSLARDSTGTYLFAGGIAATANLQMYTLNTGVLTSAASASITGTGKTVNYDTSGLQLAATH